MKSLGKFMIFLGRLVTNREPFPVYFKLFFTECVSIGISSIFLVSIVSMFVGAVIVVQTAYNMFSPFIPQYTIGLIARDMVILEIAPTFTAVVLAGKVGSNIAGQLGTMRITEQVDALEVMGINSTSYLVLPKVSAGLIMFPLLTIWAAVLGIGGGYIAAAATKVMTVPDYVEGLRSQFAPRNVPFMLIKSVVFGFLVTAISAYKGYYTEGGALEVGQASTVAVTNSCIAVLCADFILAQLLMG